MGRIAELTVAEATIAARAGAIFERSLPLLRGDDCGDGVRILSAELTALRDDARPAEWQAFCRSAFTRHPITALLHEDPITWRAYAKPRGYPGDALLLDLIYTTDAPPADCTEQGRRVWDHTVSCEEAQAVRARRTRLGALIDETAASRPAPCILSVACGHLREAADSLAVREGVFRSGGCFTALDHDRESLAEVERNFGKDGIECVNASVKSLLQGALADRRYDLVYAAGLYDYLTDACAESLTAALFALLRSGGRLLVANFARGSPSAGYMDTFAAWRLNYRDRSAVERFARLVPCVLTWERQVFEDANRAIHYLDLGRV
jgi:SAM-dependent methyltransferase